MKSNLWDGAPFVMRLCSICDKSVVMYCCLRLGVEVVYFHFSVIMWFLLIPEAKLLNVDYLKMGCDYSYCLKIWSWDGFDHGMWSYEDEEIQPGILKISEGCKSLKKSFKKVIKRSGSGDVLVSLSILLYDVFYFKNLVSQVY